MRSPRPWLRVFPEPPAMTDSTLWLDENLWTSTRFTTNVFKNVQQFLPHAISGCILQMPLCFPNPSVFAPCPALLSGSVLWTLWVRNICLVPFFPNSADSYMSTTVVGAMGHGTVRQQKAMSSRGATAAKPQRSGRQQHAMRAQPAITASVHSQLSI